MQVPAFLAVGIHLTRMAGRAKESGGRPPDGDLLWLLFLCVVAIALRYGWRLLRTKKERQRLRMRRRGQLVPVAMVQANERFFDEGNTESWPAAVLLSFDPRANGRPKEFAELAGRLRGLRFVDRRTIPFEHAEIGWRLFHEMGPVRSARVPEDLTGGLRDCVLASAILPAAPLVLDGHMWALATPGELSPDSLAVVPRSAVEGRVSWLRAFVWRWFVR
jgi:hypothetical protein